MNRVGGSADLVRMAVMLKILRLLPLMALCACGPIDSASSTPAPPQAIGAADFDSVGVERLINNKGLALQWISWDVRGTVQARRVGEALRLSGSQSDPDGGPGKLSLDGKVVEVGPGYFTLQGTIRITDAPDAGRHCEANKLWHFAITQNRQYYRLREFEWCDGLTDYVDIYF